MKLHIPTEYCARLLTDCAKNGYKLHILYNDVSRKYRLMQNEHSLITGSYVEILAALVAISVLREDCHELD